jgi:hypothetical protein
MLVDGIAARRGYSLLTVWAVSIADNETTRAATDSLARLGGTVHVSRIAKTGMQVTRKAGAADLYFL